MAWNNHDDPDDHVGRPSNLPLALLRCTARRALILMPCESLYTPTWKAGTGRWTDSRRWTAGVPNIFHEAKIDSLSTVVIPQSDFTTADLRIGTEAGDRSQVEVNKIANSPSLGVPRYRLLLISGFR